MATYTQLDYVVFGVILVSGLLALMRGFIREVFSLIAWVGAYFITVRYYTLAEPWAHRYITNPTVATYSAILFVFCVSFIILSVLGSLLAGLMRGRALNSIDRSLGFIFGLVRGALICCILYLFAVSAIWPDTDRSPEQTIAAQSEAPPVTREKTRIVAPDWLLDARTRPFLREGADELKPFIPQKEIDKSASEFMEEKAKAQRAVERQEELNRLSTPVNEERRPNSIEHTLDEKDKP